MLDHNQVPVLRLLEHLFDLTDLVVHAKPHALPCLAKVMPMRQAPAVLEDAGPSWDTGSMSSSQRTSSARAVEGHEFAGWEPAEPLSDDDRLKLERISEARDNIHDPVVRQGFVKIIEELEGDLVPTCACGWRGYPEPWTAPGSRSRRGGEQHIAHECATTIDQATQRLAASKAAAALRHAAEAWTDGEDAVRWLEARAEHIESVGLYDGERWP